MIFDPEHVTIRDHGLTALQVMLVHDRQHGDPIATVADRYSVSTRTVQDAVARAKVETLSARKPPAKCGTYGGYRRHRRLDETACADCKRAATDYELDARARRRDAA